MTDEQGGLAILVAFIIYTLATFWTIWDNDNPTWKG